MNAQVTLIVSSISTSVSHQECDRERGLRVIVSVGVGMKIRTFIRTNTEIYAAELNDECCCVILGSFEQPCHPKI